MSEGPFDPRGDMSIVDACEDLIRATPAKEGISYDVAVREIFYNNADPDVGPLDLIAVDPEHQRKGLATRLLRQAEDGLRDVGCTIVRVAGNPP